MGCSAGMQLADRGLPPGVIRGGGVHYAPSVRITSKSSFLYLLWCELDRCRSFSAVLLCNVPRETQRLCFRGEYRQYGHVGMHLRHLKEGMQSPRFVCSQLIALLDDQGPEVPLHTLSSSPKRAGAPCKDNLNPLYS